MSFLGFTIWFFISAILVGATIWSTSILMKQKRAWDSFAKKHGLTLDKGKFFSSPSLSGHYDGLKVELFAAERQAMDVRERRMLTAIEMTSPTGLVDGGVVGTEEMRPFMQSLGALHAYTPAVPGWDDALKFFVRDDAVMNDWLNEGKMKTIIALVGTKHSDNLLIFDDTQAIIRVETRDPMTDPDKMEKILARLASHLKALAD